MGNIEDYTKSAKDKMKDTQQTIETQKVLAETLHDNFYLKAMQGLPNQFKTDKNITHKSGTHITSVKSTQVPEGVQKVLSAENWGQLGEYIKNNIAKVIQDLVGRSSGSYQKKTEYVVTVGTLGAVIRIDYQVVAMQMQAMAWGLNEEKSMVIYDYLVSNVDGRDLKKYQLAAIIQNSSSLHPKAQQQIFQKALELYQLDKK